MGGWLLNSVYELRGIGEDKGWKDALQPGYQYQLTARRRRGILAKNGGLCVNTRSIQEDRRRIDLSSIAIV